MNNLESRAIPLAQGVLGMTFKAAQKHVDALVESGVLTLVGNSKRDRVFIAEEIVRAIQGDDG